MHDAEPHRTKMQVPDVIVDKLDANALARHRLADKHRVSVAI